MDKNKIYYVYEYFNIETGYIFYVGKGCKYRMTEMYSGSRNIFFEKYYNSNKCDCRKIYEKLNEQTALNIEHERILELKKQNMCCCNIDNGGKIGGRSIGEKNGFFGKKHSKEVIERIRAINSDGRNKGENNSQYGISPKQRMTPEKYEEWKEKHRKLMSGENNTQYGVSPQKRMTPEKYKIWLKTQNKGCGSFNPNAKSIIMYKDGFEKCFGSMIECAEYLILENYTKSIKKCIQSSISNSIKHNKTYLNFYFKFNN